MKFAKNAKVPKNFILKIFKIKPFYFKREKDTKYIIIFNIFFYKVFYVLIVLI